MSERTQSRGECSYCGALIARGGSRRHLDSCARRKAAIAEAEASGGAAEPLLHLRVENADSSAFWLDLEMRGAASLKTLDSYLRAIWLECCGHLSRFSTGEWGAGEIPMTRKAKDVFRPGITLTHMYDFGTPTVTQVKLVAARTGTPASSRPMKLMMRNVMPEAPCAKCEAPATHLCMGCFEEMEEVATLCAAHAKKHRHRDWDAPILLVNSPRLGMCGYDGPAAEPYA
jgi:hypothetical protein